MADEYEYSIQRTYEGDKWQVVKKKAGDQLNTTVSVHETEEDAKKALKRLKGK